MQVALYGAAPRRKINQEMGILVSASLGFCRLQKIDSILLRHEIQFVSFVTWSLLGRNEKINIFVVLEILHSIL